MATTTGPIDFGGLPRGLKELLLTNGFQNISFVPERLPPNLEILNVDLNGLTSVVNFSKFPRSVKDAERFAVFAVKGGGVQWKGEGVKIK